MGLQVGMSIDPKLLVSNFPVIIGTLALLIGGKTILVAVVGRFFGISIVSAIRVGLLLAPGGEFAFVAFGEAVNQVFLSKNYMFPLENFTALIVNGLGSFANFLGIISWYCIQYVALTVSWLP